MKRSIYLGIGLAVLIAVIAGAVFFLKPSNAPQDAHYSKLDYKAIDAKGLSRLTIETTYDGCTSTCDVGSRSVCEKNCACVLNASIESMTKEEVDSMIATMGLSHTMVPKVQMLFEKAVASCK